MQNNPDPAAAGRKYYLRMELGRPVSYHEESAEMNLFNIQNTFFLDISTIIILIVIAYLSKRLGEALKTLPFYKLLYGAVGFIIASAVLNSFAVNNVLDISIKTLNTVSMGIRFFAGIISVFACLQYWKWLFSELFKN
ncbi:MAG: hypothetical protein L0Y76_10560 [Ignavibacteria bacterium]|nr:hypothetical protein [Ignavibacteria bacterium]